MNIYSSLNRMEVHNVKNALQAAGIECEIRGEFRRAAMGEIPISESYVEVWLLDPSQEEQARKVLAGDREASSWVCANCDETVGGVFGSCWNCQTDRPQDEGEGEGESR